MRRLDRLTFRVPDANACCSFYEQVLGMSSVPSPRSPSSETTHGKPDKVLGFASNSKGLKLAFVEPMDSNTSASPDNNITGASTSTLPTSIRACTARQSTSKDAYWKIGITVKHLDSAVAYLQKQGVTVSKPVQFQDIGYLCHLRDPAGMSIELLQHAFQGKEHDINDDKNASDNHLHPIGRQATVAHITLRTTNLPKLQHWCSQEMEMQLLSIQPVSDYGFTLYFYGWSNDSATMPDPTNLKAVVNRPWLWARPYALIEIQHLEQNNGKNEPQTQLRPTALDEAGPVELLVMETKATSNESVFCRIDCHKDLGL